jgi:hypothetical protein
MSVAASIALLHVRVWFNGLARSTGSRRAATGLLGFLGCLLIAWLIFGTISMSSQVRTDSGSVAYLVKPLAAVLFAFPAIATLFVTVYSVGSSMIDNIIAVLPIEERDRINAGRWLSVALGFIMGAVVATPLAVQFLTVLTPWIAVVSGAGCLLISLIGALVARFMVTCLEFLCSWMLGRGQLVNAISSVAAAVLIAWAFLAALPIGRGRVGDGPVALLSVPLNWAVDGSVSPLLMLPVYVCTNGAILLAIRVVDEIPRSKRTGRLTLPARLAVFPARTLVGLELRQWLRFPSNSVFLGFSGILAIIAAISWGRSMNADQWSALGYIFLALASTVGVGSFGPTRPAHWIYATIGRPLGWAVPKLSAVLIVWMASIVGLLFALEILTSWQASDAWSLLPTLLVELVAGCVVGLLLPVSQEQSLGTAFSELVAVGIVFSVPMVLQSLPLPNSTIFFVIAHIGGMAALLGIYLVVGRECSRHRLIV